ncbi:MAG: hypothetical protein LBC92_03835, partial [Rickettsiales bacterium]|nr:hypothetical protein [Rickettsiales bacterium]
MSSIRVLSIQHALGYFADDLKQYQLTDKEEYEESNIESQDKTKQEKQQLIDEANKSNRRKELIYNLNNKVLNNKEQPIININTNYTSNLRNKEDWNNKVISKDIIKHLGNDREAINKEIGSIHISNKSINSMLQHGKFKNKLNIEMFYNSKILFENAKVLNYTERFKDRKYDSYLMATLVRYDNKDYVVEIVT